MNITVFGATGHVGSLVVEKLLAGGHNVSAFTHGPHQFADTTRLRIISGDIHNPEDIENALSDSEAVISCLGSWHTPTKDILSAAMTSVVPIAEKHGIKRVISLTGSAACTPGDSLGIIDKLNRSMLSLIAPKILKDGEEHIRLLAESTLDWTVIRSPVMTNNDDADYRLDMNAPSPIATIPRAAVVAALVDSLEDARFIRAAPYIHQ
jgi:putative NADH-flavin reductase